ncbi:NUDIX domain-containing protein [Pseudolactococcus yaeyamensis]
MERFDIYDDTRKLTERTAVRGQELKADDYRLIVHVSIMNSKNQLLIQKRQPHKQAWPGFWDISVGGGALAGETSKEAAMREVFEELGLRLDLSEVAPSFMVKFPNGFADEYIIYQDVDLTTLHLQTAEVQAVKWASYDEVMAMVDQGTFFPYQEPMLALIFSFSKMEEKHD